MRYRSLIVPALLCLSASAAHAALVVQPNETIVMLGTSITVGNGDPPLTEAWYTGALAQINAHYAPTVLVSTTKVAATSMKIAISAPTVPDRRPTVFNAGVDGNKIAQMTARVSTDVCAHRPTIVFIEGSVNDVFVTSTGTYATNATALASAVAACSPAPREVAWVGIFADGEIFPDTSAGATISSFESSNQSACAGIGCTYIDVRTPQQALEQAHNTPSPGVTGGLLTADNVHPQFAIVPPMPESGIDVYTTATMAQVAFSQ